MAMRIASSTIKLIMLKVYGEFMTCNQPQDPFSAETQYSINNTCQDTKSSNVDQLTNSSSRSKFTAAAHQSLPLQSAAVGGACMLPKHRRKANKRSEFALSVLSVLATPAPRVESVTLSCGMRRHS